MRKSTIYMDIHENKGTDQLRSKCQADQRLCFTYSDSTIADFLSLSPLAIFCACTAQFVSDLFGNHIVGFLMMRHKQMSRLMGKPAMWFPNRSDTNRPVQAQKQARSMKFRS